MSLILRSAHGASEYTRADDYPTQTLSQHGILATNPHEPADRTWSELIDELLRIRKLEDDWDGEGTEAPHPTLVDGAISLAQDLRATACPAADRVIASVNGTIVFEWFTPLGYSEAEVIAPDEAELRWLGKGSSETEVCFLYRHS
ncbi:MAG: hypothetical protein U0746_15840 [Gemmataceae bacterium]